MSNRIFLFYGEEDFLIEQKINELKADISNPALNVEMIDGEEALLERVVSALQSQSLLGGERLVIICRVDPKANLWNDLIPALEMISPGTTVVFWASGVDKRSKFYKFIDAKGEVCEFRPFSEWEQEQVISWIRRRVISSGKKIGNEAARELQEICGNNLRKLNSEVEKLITYIGERENIETRDIETLASPGEMNVFALSDAVAEKDLKASLHNFHVLYKNKMDPFRMLSLLANQFRTMLITKSEKNPQEVAQRYGASPYYIKKCMQKAFNFDEDELKRGLELLLEADLELKSGRQQLPTLELLLASLCGK